MRINKYWIWMPVFLAQWLIYHWPTRWTKYDENGNAMWLRGKTIDKYTR